MNWEKAGENKLVKGQDCISTEPAAQRFYVKMSKQRTRYTPIVYVEFSGRQILLCKEVLKSLCHPHFVVQG